MHVRRLPCSGGPCSKESMHHFSRFWQLNYFSEQQSDTCHVLWSELAIITASDKLPELSYGPHTVATTALSTLDA